MPFRKTFLLVAACSLIVVAVGTQSMWTAVVVALIGSWIVGSRLQVVADQPADEIPPAAVDNSASDDIHSEVNRLSTVLSSMVQAVIAVDNSERILFANPAAKNVFDGGTDRVIGRPIWEVIRNATVQEVVRTALTGHEQQVECELPRSKTIVSIVSTALEGDPCPGVVLVLNDVTRLRQLEAMRQEFVSNVSHELKTPLTVIKACTDTLLDGAIDDSEYNRKFLGRIESQAERLHRLILDLLHLSSIESEEEVFEFVQLDLGRLIHESVEKEESVAEGRDIRLRCEIPEPAPVIQGDQEALQTILGNLIENAIRYSPDGDTVTITCRTEDERALIQVTDNGQGIPSVHLDRIFERFYRVDRARSREMGGTGLGLAIVKHLTQIHGGSVACDSKVGQGSTFTISLPFKIPLKHG